MSDTIRTDKSSLLNAQIWLRTMADFDAMHTVWNPRVVPGNTPVRCCGKVEMTDPAWRFEIVVTAGA